MMRPEHVHAVTNPTAHVIEMVTGVRAKMDKAQVAYDLEFGDRICVGCTFTGDAGGGIFLTLDKGVAFNIANRMVFEPIRDQNDPEVYTAILELINMIAGNAVGTLGKAALAVSISTPILYADAPEVPASAECVVAKMISVLGTVDVALVIDLKED